MNRAPRRSAEQRLQIAYVAAFAAVLAIVAGLVFLAFRQSLRIEAYDRLDALARNAFEQIRVHGPRVEIETDSNDLAAPERLFARREAVDWYVEHRRVRHAGIAVPPLDGRGRAADGARYFTRTVVSHGVRPSVAVRVAESEEATDGPLRQLAVVLAVGWFITSLGAGVFGNVLGRRIFATLDAAARRQGEFVADASHELRGPLTVIETNASSMLRDGTASDDRVRARLENVMDAARQMDRLAARLLLLARLDSVDHPARVAVDLAEVGAAILTVYRPLAEGRDLQFSAQLDTASAFGEPDDVRRIIENIVENAIAYTPAGGTISLATGIEGNTPTVTIRDTGIGIASDDIPRIFDRFWRGDPVRGSATSAGLGLAIVRRLLLRNDGSISVTSALGAGSTFVVRFPARAAIER